MPVQLAVHRIARSACLVLPALFGSAAHAAQSGAPDVDLATSTSSTYGGGEISVLGQANAWFQADTTQPAGTGVFNPFLRVQVTGSGTPKEASEQGYNTSTPNPQSVFDNKNPTNWTHDVKFTDLATVTKSGVVYYQFKLDINEPSSATNSLLSLDGLRLFATNTGSQNSTNTFGTGSTNQPGDWNWNSGSSTGLNTLLWDLDKNASGVTDPNNRYILLDRDRNGGGSGIADMVVLFEKTAIDAAKGSATNLILWSRFGIANGAYDSGNTADGGFEEWSFLGKTSNGNCSGTNCPPGGGGGGSVPVPNSILLAMLGLGLLSLRKGRSGRLMSVAG